MSYKVSIIIPTHNRPDLLVRALWSVYGQTFQDYEVIVVDDGDSPRAESVLQEYLGNSNFTYLETNKNQGAPVARNMGIKAAQGEYVGFLDDDDEWLPEKLSLQTEILDKESADVGFVFSAVVNKHENGSVTTKVDPSVRDYSEISLRRFNGFLTSGLLIRKTALDEVGGFDESLPSHQDPDLVIRLTRSYQAVGLEEGLVIMGASETGDHIGGNVGNKIKGRTMLLTKHKELYERHPKIYAKKLFELGIIQRDNKLTEEALNTFKKSSKYNFNLRTFIHMFLVKLQKAKFQIIKLIKPAHFGTMLREMYAKKYLPKKLTSENEILIYDAGCGKGQYSMFLSRMYPNSKIIATDLNRFSDWENYPDYPNIEFHKQDLTIFEETNKYDLVVSIDVLEHILNNDNVIQRLCRSLKKEGYLYFGIPCDRTAPHIFPEKYFSQFREWEKDEHIGEQRLLEEWIDLIEAEGFEIKLSRHTFTLWGRFAWEIEYFLRGNKWGNRINLLLTPVYRLFGLLDIYLPISKGNNLIVAKKQ